MPRVNCGAALAGPFCAECGQRAVPPHPSVAELAGDALTEFSGWDGKFAETMRLLLLKPGELTRQWLDGRRVHFIAPLRLYLTASLVFFLVQSATPRSRNGQFRVTVDKGAARSNPDIAASAAEKAFDSGKPLTPAERDSAMKAIAKAPAIIKPMLTRMVDDPNALKTGIRQIAPKMLFALLPFYAGILMLFYRRRHYPEHLYFAIHLHAFVFLALTLDGLTKFVRIPVLGTVLGLATMAWVVCYSVLALRRVYGGMWLATIAKSVAIMCLYLLVALPVLVLTILLAAT